MQRVRIAALAVVVATARSGSAQTSPPHFFVLDRRGNGLELSGTNKTLGTRWTTAQTDDAFLAVDSTGLRAMGIEITTRQRVRLDGPTLVSTNLRIVVDGQSRNIDRTWQLLVAFDANGDGRIDSRDPAWVHLRLFVDTDGDGRMESTEIHGLIDGSIVAIATKPGRDPRTDALGNVLTESWLTANDRRARTSADVAFAKLPVP